jgi:hypothetical protein
MRAKGGAGTGMFHPHRSVRQANDVKEPRQRREDRPPLSDPRLRYHQSMPPVKWCAFILIATAMQLTSTEQLFALNINNAQLDYQEICLK